MQKLSVIYSILSGFWYIVIRRFMFPSDDFSIVEIRHHGNFYMFIYANYKNDLLKVH